MRFDVVTIFPDYFAPLSLSLVGKAAQAQMVEFGVHDLRDWTHDRHRSVDDTPYGGGAGMVMKAEPWGEALDSLLSATASSTLTATSGTATVSSAPTLIVPTPAGRPFTQADAASFAEQDWLIIACGRYEGIDQRVVEYARTRMPVAEVSLGDYVLNGGEVAALAIIEAVVRLLPGVLGNPESLLEESHAADLDGLLEYPVYSKPASWRGFDVPEVLLSGNHKEIAKWRHAQALRRTEENRPDLI
ncbi:MAG: tRNA (guanosine(37)-N1)-methyltransferase TrmD [Propionibacteriaceae bacterium]|jgi:tRNA (guanine37-N1)-methyltransferase|nr:tRNA (guanosine(37)-N1)-methyltransferase TrmD [Propionibacteriaceae bacterium]